MSDAGTKEPLSDIDRHIALMEIRLDRVENLYKKMEEHCPCDPLTDAQMEEVNRHLGFPTMGPHAKTRDYRPYCIQNGCRDMPRMMRIRDGFKCWSCFHEWKLKSK